MKYKILNNINSPEDLKALSDGDIPALCEEIREFLIEKVETSGGHLASNLGVTELTVALHRVFDSPRDHIIFDTGHQSYVHKILTGRRDRFDELRIPGGLSGFPRMSESEHDAFGVGHSSTSISAALGYAEAAALNGTDEHTVCVIGDGAYAGGMVHEALNNCRPDLKLVIILNENGMAISENVGAFADCFTPAVALSRQDRPHYFECLGLSYIGPVDGNDYHAIAAALEQAKSAGKCVVLHVKTAKGKGYLPAENSPTEYHSVKSGNADITFHSVFVDKLIKKAKIDKKIVAVTDAMGVGTGVEAFGKSFPDRYFDVGIAEAHALTFAAGLAAAGYRPHVAIYSTFLQRGYDSILHDVALQNLPVRIIIDRAGLATADGATHHGIFDVAFLSHVPGIELYAPASFSSLSRLVDYDDIKHPLAIRYPNASELDFVDREFGEIPSGTVPSIRADFAPGVKKKLVFITYGNILAEVYKAKTSLSARGIDTGIILVEKLKPYADVCEKIYGLISSADHVVYVEEGIKNGGAAMITGSTLLETGLDTSKTTYDIIAIDDNFASPEKIIDIYDYTGLSAEKIIEKCENLTART